MAFKKGEVGNPKGRPKGSKNKLNAEARTALKRLLEQSIPQIKRDLRKMNAKDRVDCLIRLSAYILPKQKMVTVTNYPEWGEFLELTPEQRKKEMLLLEQKIKDLEKNEQIETIEGEAKIIEGD